MSLAPENEGSIVKSLERIAACLETAPLPEILEALQHIEIELRNLRK